MRVRVGSACSCAYVRAYTILDKPPPPPPPPTHIWTFNMKTLRLRYCWMNTASQRVTFRLLHVETEPWHDKTNKMIVRPAKTQISLGVRPVWSESSLCAQWVAKDPRFLLLHAGSEDSNQTGWMPRLIWIFAGRTAILLVLSCRGSDVFEMDRFFSMLAQSSNGKTTNRSSGNAIIKRRSALLQSNRKNRKTWNHNSEVDT